MFIVNLSGGIGNNFFQYFFGESLSIINKRKTFYNISYYKNYKKTDFKCELENFINKDQFINIDKNFNNISIKIKKKLISTGIKKFDEIYVEKENKYIEIKNLDKIKYLYGHFQSYKYFNNHFNQIKNKVFFPEDSDLTFQNILKKISSTNSIGIFIRRSDYVNNNKVNAIHGYCDINYYKNAINYINQKKGETEIFIFSDDLEWCVETFQNNNYNYINVNSKKKYMDLILLKNCKYIISSNSTFSWWAAYLNENKDKVIIVPNKWFKIDRLNKNLMDLIPPNWVKLENTLL